LQNSLEQEKVPEYQYLTPPTSSAVALRPFRLTVSCVNRGENRHLQIISAALPFHRTSVLFPDHFETGLRQVLLTVIQYLQAPYTSAPPWLSRSTGPHQLFVTFLNKQKYFVARSSAPSFVPLNRDFQGLTAVGLQNYTVPSVQQGPSGPINAKPRRKKHRCFQVLANHCILLSPHDAPQFSGMSASPTGFKEAERRNGGPAGP
jgi:hypothetical protein